MIEKIDSGTHVAYLDAMAGAGVLVSSGVPYGNGDVSIGKGRTLRETGWNAIVRALRYEGWSILDDEYGDVPLLLATTGLGGVAYALWQTTGDDVEHGVWVTELRTLLERVGGDWHVTDDFAA